jgi:hypothetical protein
MLTEASESWSIERVCNNCKALQHEAKLVYVRADLLALPARRDSAVSAADHDHEPDLE